MTREATMSDIVSRINETRTRLSQLSKEDVQLSRYERQTLQGVYNKRIDTFLDMLAKL